jgi:hypothetical protein
MQVRIVRCNRVITNKIGKPIFQLPLRAIPHFRWRVFRKVSCTPSRVELHSVILKGAWRGGSMRAPSRTLGVSSRTLQPTPLQPGAVQAGGGSAGGSWRGSSRTTLWPGSLFRAGFQFLFGLSYLLSEFCVGPKSGMNCE